MTISTTQRTRVLAIGLALAAAASGASSAHAAGKVEVSFIKPEQFADVGFASFERERNLRALTDHFQRLAKKLPDNQTLHVDVLDVDLAGQSSPASPSELRVLRGGADWPRMTLRYSLTEGTDGGVNATPSGATAGTASGTINGTRTIQSGEQQLSDMNYHFSALVGSNAQAPLGYEQRMLERWFDATFGKGR